MLVVCLLFLIALTAKECLGGSSKSRFVNFQQHSGAITSCEHDSAIRSCTAIYVDTNSPPRLPLEYSFEVVAQDLDPSVHWIVKADINGDGRPDLISVVFGSLGRHTWFENTGNADQPFVSHVITSGKEGSIHMDVGDVNGDGHLDVILAYKWGHCFMACTKKDGKVGKNIFCRIHG